MESRWKRRLWIVDGHNAIFALPALQRLQREGERQQARRKLEGLLQPFAQQLERPLVVVYDGNAMLPNPDAVSSGQLQTLYSQPPEEADDRIAFLAEQASSRGETVTVVTDDRGTLGVRLPEPVQVLAVGVFCDRYLCRESDSETEEKRLPREDARAIEGLFLSRQEEIETRAARGARRRERDATRLWRARVGRPERPMERERPREDEYVPPPLPSRPRRESAPAPRPAGPDEAPPKETSAEAVRAREAKRKRGQRKQQRRLEGMRRKGRGKRHRR